MSDSNRVIMGGYMHVIGGWGKYRIDSHKVNYDINKDDKKFEDIIKFFNLDNDAIQEIDSMYIIKCVIDDRKLIKQMKKLYEILAKYEKNIFKTLKHKKFINISITSNDLQYIINNSNMCDLYVLKSIYEDLVKLNNNICNKKIELMNLVIIDPFNKTIDKSNIESLLEIEEKNEKYIARIEHFHVKIIETIEYIITHIN